MPTSGAAQSTEWGCGAESTIIASDKPGNHRRFANVMVATGYTRGYEADSIEEIVRRLGGEETAVDVALEMVQDLDPAGVAARDLRECLTIQVP